MQSINNLYSSKDVQISSQGTVKYGRYLRFLLFPFNRHLYTKAKAVHTIHSGNKMETNGWKQKRSALQKMAAAVVVFEVVESEKCGF